MASNAWNISNIKEISKIRANTLTLPFLKHLQAINPSFVTITKPLKNKIGETFCEGLKWICKLFKKNGQKDL